MEVKTADRKPGPLPEATVADSVRMFIDHFVATFVSQRSPSEDLDGLHPLIIGSMENHLILSVLKKCRGNKVRAAKVLGLHRNTLAQKIAAMDGPRVKVAARKPASGLRHATRAGRKVRGHA